MSAILTLAAVTALAVSPQCGAAKPDSDLARRLVATAQAESGFDPNTIHVNGEGGGARHYKSEVDAIVAALEFEASGIDIDVGLMQINRRQFDRHGLTLHIGSAFDPCKNMRAGSDHLVDDVRSVWNRASRRYNCGGINCGIAYARRIDEFVAQAHDTPAHAPDSSPAPSAPPTLRDALRDQESGGLIDLLAGHHPQKPAPVDSNVGKEN